MTELILGLIVGGLMGFIVGVKVSEPKRINPILHTDDDLRFLVQGRVVIDTHKDLYLPCRVNNVVRVCDALNDGVNPSTYQWYDNYDECVAVTETLSSRQGA